jgi:hypothetical protein
MPNKILRLHTSGSNAQAGWSATGPIGRKEADEILDPQANQATNVAVSIPSPFARLHLVVGALDYVSKHPTDTQSAYHQLVSHFWDLWEVVFNHHQHRLAKQPLTVRPWNRAEELPRLTANPATQPLAQVLALYWENEPFSSFPEMALLRWPLPDGTSQLLGGTSPLTLFFPAPDVQPLLRPDGTKVNRANGVGAYFDAQYVALNTRENKFRQYVYHLFAFEPALAGGSLAPAVLAVLDNAQLAALKMGTPAELTALYPTLTDYRGNPVYVGSWPVRIRPDVSIVHDSDFFIRASRPQGDKKRPIVLRPGLKAPGKKYYNDTLWDDKAVVPPTDSLNLPDRTLPGVGFQYPYLTTGDFLEDTLLAVPYEMDATRFHTGQVKVDPKAPRTFWPLLPLRPEYFLYFTPADLAKHLEIEVWADFVTVKLSIPVGAEAENRVVEYKRDYHEKPVLDDVGRLLVTNVGLSIFPFVKVKDAPQFNDFYKVMLVDANNLDPTLVDKPVTLAFWHGDRELRAGDKLQSATPYVRTPKTGTDEGSTYYEVRGAPEIGAAFDFLAVRHPAPGSPQALVVPKWREVTQGTKSFRFAIDFGTTNTHVAWSDDQIRVESLRFGADDSPVALLKKPLEDPAQTLYDRTFAGIRRGGYINLRLWQDYTEREFVPNLIGAEGAPFAFPIRTATSEAADYTTQQATLLGNVNVGFGFITEEQVNASYTTNLKWQMGNDEFSQHRVGAFIQEMMLLFRTKAALNQGRLDKTGVTWFAPLSFSHHQRSQFQAEWDRAFREVFHTEGSTQRVAESTAPYYYLTGRHLITLGPDDRAAFIDVGGGTTDVLFYADQQPVLNSSFRFAANDLWGDGGARVRGAKDNGGLPSAAHKAL